MTSSVYRPRVLLTVLQGEAGSPPQKTDIARFNSAEVEKPVLDPLGRFKTESLFGSKR